VFSQLRTSAVNVTLLEFALQSAIRCCAPCCGNATAERPAAAAVDQYQLISRSVLLARRSAANPLQRLTDDETDGRSHP